MDFKVKQAKRELIWSKIALMSPSGGGKTYSSLRLATGMLRKLKEIGQEQNGKILFVNTEQKRGYYYANEFSYDIVDMTAPHHPENYVEVLDFAVKQKYPIVILDSTSHEWEGKGGCLELHQQAGGSYQTWGKITPRHNKFIEAIADSPIHVIATMRGKDQYEIEKGENSKLGVKKLGVGAKQRDGFEYEFTVTFMLDQKTNMATPQKDNTHIFENEGDVLLSEKHGERIIEWANSGEGYTPPIRNTADPVAELEEAKKNIIELCKDLGGQNDKEVMGLITIHGNPKALKEIAKANAFLEALHEIKTARETSSNEPQAE